MIFGTEFAARVLAYFTASPAAPAIFPQLTEWEREVLELVAQGRSNADIAGRLQLSQKTARNHGGRSGPVTPAHTAAIEGIRGWQALLVAIGAVLAGAVLAVLHERARAARQLLHRNVPGHERAGCTLTVRAHRRAPGGPGARQRGVHRG